MGKAEIFTCVVGCPVSLTAGAAALYIDCRVSYLCSAVVCGVCKWLWAVAILRACILGYVYKCQYVVKRFMTMYVRPCHKFVV